MSIFFYNSDFEEKLFAGKFLERQITKRTTEFEFLIHLLNPSAILYSKKKYSDDYQYFIKNFCGQEIKTTFCKDNVIPWCNDYSQVDLSRKLQSKKQTLLLLQNEKLLPHDIEVISDESTLKQNYLYKNSISQSGGGHMLYPKDKMRILKSISRGISLIGEPLLSRVLDFSTLFCGQEKVCIYQNDIDDKFQYKGTIIGLDSSYLNEFLIDYEKAIQVILSYTANFNGYYSVDSFIFEKNGTHFLYPACEINARKTMGFIAFELKNKYFPLRKLLKMKLIKNQGQKIQYDILQKIFGENVYLISPIDNRFFVFVLLADDKDRLTEVERKLLSTFF